MVHKVVFIFLALLLFFCISLLLLNNKSVTSDPIIIKSSCQLTKQACLVSLPSDKQLRVALEPSGFAAMEKLYLSVDALQVDIDVSKIWFEGLHMNMGLHFMLPTHKNIKSSKNKYQFEGMIPVCTIDTDMLWLLKINISYLENLYQIQFQLNADTKKL